MTAILRDSILTLEVRPSRGWHLAWPLAALATLVALGTSGRPLEAQGGDGAPVFPDLPSSAPVGSGRLVPCLEGIEGEVRCGRFRVREDRGATSGRTLDLAFVVLRALESGDASDAVVPFSGGPGASTIDAVSRIAARLMDVRRTRDILLIDHRGTGASGALTCTVPYPDGVASRFATVFPLAHAAVCRDVLASRADLSAYTTAAAMDDLADVTSWLGYRGLNLVGSSYGTREALVFARRHPDLTRTLVLDGVAPLWEPLYVHHARYLQGALEGLYTECEAEPQCRTSFPGLRQLTDSLFERVRVEPPRVRADEEAVVFGPGALAYALRGLLYAGAGRVPAMLAQARSGDWQPLADYYLERQAWVGGGSFPAGYHFSVLCAEDIDRTSDELVASATAGTFMGDHLIAAYRAVCALWPAAELPDEYFTPVTSDVPTLLLSGARDPVTPPSGAEATARHLSRSVHVVVPNGGHGQGGPCVIAMIVRLFEDASVERIDASCIRQRPPTRFETRSGR